MTLRHLRIFLSVCDHGCSTTKAADALHITQPAVSLAIRELESHYKVSFFERVGRRLVLNDSGQRLRQYALQITALFDAMEDELCAPLTASLRIGASITIGSHFLPSYVRIFQEQHPGVYHSIFIVSVFPTGRCREIRQLPVRFFDRSGRKFRRAITAR